MKRCPNCRRDYTDDMLLYCLDDGTPLLDGPATIRSSDDEPATAILSEPGAIATGFRGGEEQTRQQIPTTDQTAIFPRGAEAEPQRNLGDLSERPSLSAHRAAKPLVIIGVAVTLLVGGFFGYRYFKPTTTEQINSIAVMPFINDSGSPDVEYLSDGMTETLISSLSQLPALNVKPRSLVFKYKGKETDLQALGKELGVQAILNGRVAQRGEDLSLFVELIDVASTKVIWSRQYNQKQSDIVSLQSEIARDVSNKLKANLSGEDEKKVTKNSTNNPQAYRLYLLGNSLAVRRKQKDIVKAIENYEQAIALDPNYALAYTGLGNAHVLSAIYAGSPGAVELPKAQAAVSKAIEIDPTLAEAHNVLGLILLFIDHDFAAHERENRRALELNPNLANAHRQNGVRLSFLGRFDEANVSFQRALELEPLALATNINIAWTLFYAGRIAESDAQIKVTQQIDPSFWFIEYQLFVNARAKRDYAAAVEHLARAQELRDDPEAAKFIREAFMKGGWSGFMRDALAEPERSKIWDYYLATFAAELGDNDRAFTLLGKAYEKYDQFILFMKIDQLMNPLRGDPRFADLLKKLGFPQ